MGKFKPSAKTNAFGETVHFYHRALSVGLAAALGASLTLIFAPSVVIALSVVWCCGCALMLKIRKSQWSNSLIDDAMKHLGFYGDDV